MRKWPSEGLMVLAGMIVVGGLACHDLCLRDITSPAPVEPPPTRLVRGTVPPLTLACVVDNGTDPTVTLRIDVDSSLLSDVDGDGDVDLIDFRMMLQEFTGP